MVLPFITASPTDIFSVVGHYTRFIISVSRFTFPFASVCAFLNVVFQVTAR